MKERQNDIPTAFMREGVVLVLGGHLGSDNAPVQTLELVLIDDGEQEVAVSFRSPWRRHGDDDCESVLQWLFVSKSNAARQTVGALRFEGE